MRAFAWAVCFVALLLCALVLAALVAGSNLKIGGGGEQMSHFLSVREPWLELIRTGVKKVEGRKGPPFTAWVGHELELKSGKQTVRTKVTAVRHYPSLPAYLEAEGWQNVAPHLHSFEETLAAYREFYSDAAVAAGGGMNAIQIEVIA